MPPVKRSKRPLSGAILVGKVSFRMSDGETARWPTKFTAPPSRDSHEYFRIDDADANKRMPPMVQEKRKKVLSNWKVAIGTHIAKRLREIQEPSAPNRNLKYTLESFPAGYALFAQKRIKDPDREDYYLCGSTIGSVFRSPEEFFPHGVWLRLKPDDPSLLCDCTYCTKHRQNEDSSTKALDVVAPLF